jgi:hypothetical protein
MGKMKSKMLHKLVMTRNLTQNKSENVATKQEMSTEKELPTSHRDPTAWDARMASCVELCGGNQKSNDQSVKMELMDASFTYKLYLVYWKI